MLNKKRNKLRLSNLVKYVEKVRLLSGRCGDCITTNCGGCKTTALHSIIEKKVNKNSENIKGNTVI